ncbi:MAG: peptidoglycan editing factor PgeF [Desulfobacteraceae bacterium]
MRESLQGRDLSEPASGGIFFEQGNADKPGAGLPRLRFSMLSGLKGLSHAVFTRQGGVSLPPCESLNVGLRTPDRPEAVRTNLELIRLAMGAKRLVYLDQVHGTEVVSLKKGGHTIPYSRVKADGMITDIPGLGLLIKQADCQAVILYDPVRGVTGNIHCGWRGSVGGILGAAIMQMSRDFGTDPRDVFAAVGPSLGPCCAEFVGHERLFPPWFKRFMLSGDRFDFWAISRRQLIEAGLHPGRIATAGLCTRCRTDLFFSYRGEGETGRFASVAMLTE